jgi:hypothetical protein
MAGEENWKNIAHVNMMFNYIPYIQTNLYLGSTLMKERPFELTKRFVDKSPAVSGIFITQCFWRRSLNLEYQRQIACCLFLSLFLIIILR